MNHCPYQLLLLFFFLIPEYCHPVPIKNNSFLLLFLMVKKKKVDFQAHFIIIILVGFVLVLMEFIKSFLVKIF